ncbi:tRNA (uridine(54)-C5)-methyltransferase TrmA [Spongorhabdus nitratireducens]
MKSVFTGDADNTMTPGAIFPEQYTALLDDKAARLRADFGPFDVPELEVFRSRDRHFRMRAEFKIWRHDGKLDYAMFRKGCKNEPILLQDYPIGSEAINALMQPLLDACREQEVLAHRLFQIEFLSTLSGEMLVTLIYHKALGEEWIEAARPLQKQFNIKLIGRARKQKIVLEEDFVTEALTVNGRIWRYQQVENSFTQPNAGINEQMLGWAEGATTDFSGDLLELYCGNANFTCVLSRNFDKVLATEISKTSVNSARHNFSLNGVRNAEIARMSSEEFTQAMNKEREFNRLKGIDLDSYEFSTVFVDPPRSGLDKGTEALVQRFDNIVYISCNPETLRENLETLTQTHSVERFALFDQFPYTDHAECGVLLKRRS